MTSYPELYYACKWNGPGTTRGAALVLNYVFRGYVNLERIGSERDMERITKVLRDHGYEATGDPELEPTGGTTISIGFPYTCQFVYKNFADDNSETASLLDTEETLKKFIEDDIHGKEDTDSTVVVIMSHGDAAHEFTGSVFLTGDHVWMASQPVVDKFQHVRGLEGKPKLFFFNFCRVEQPLHDLSEDALKEKMDSYFRREAEFWLNEPAVRNAIPDQKSNRLYNDTLIVYSTIPRFPSYRSTVFGSFFMQDLCQVLEDPKLFATKDIALLLDEVDKKLKTRATEMEDDEEFKYCTQTPDRINRGFNKKFYLRSFHKLRSYYLDHLCNVKPLPWSTQFNWSVDEIYTPLVMTNADHSKESFPPEQLFQRLEKRFLNGSGFRCLIEGNPGYGKSTLMLKLTSDWAKPSSCSYLSGFHLVFLVKLGEVGKKGALEKRLRELYEDKMDFTSTTDIFKGELADGVLVLLDGYDEASEKTKETVHRIMVKELWSQSHVVLTSRFGYVTDDLKSNSNALCAKLEGFHKRDVAVAVGKFLIKAGHRTKHEVLETMLEQLIQWRNWAYQEEEEEEVEEEEEEEVEEEEEEEGEEEEVGSWPTDDDSTKDPEQDDDDYDTEDDISEYSDCNNITLEDFQHVQARIPLLPEESRLNKYQLENFLWKLLRSTPYKDLAECPLLCFMFCCLVTEFPENRLPNSMTDLYFAIINRNLYRAAFRKAPPRQFNEKWDWKLLKSKFRKDYEENLKDFGLSCLEYIQSNAPHFTLFDLTFDTETSDPYHPNVAILLEAGVIVEGDSTPFNTVYYPMHRTMAEFLAAYYLMEEEDKHLVGGHFLEIYSKNSSFIEICYFCYELDKEKKRTNRLTESAKGSIQDYNDKEMTIEVFCTGFAVRTEGSHEHFVTRNSVSFSFENLAATSAWNDLLLVLQKCIERKRKLEKISITAVGLSGESQLENLQQNLFFLVRGAENSDAVAVSREKCVGILKSLIGSAVCPREIDIQMKGVESSKEGQEMQDQGEEVLMALLTAIRDPPEHCVLWWLQLKHFRLKGESAESFITTILKSSIGRLELEHLRKLVKEYTAGVGFRLEDICTDETQWTPQDPEAFNLDPTPFPLKELWIRKSEFTPKLLEWIAASVFKLRKLIFYITPPGNWHLETQVLRMLLTNNANTLEEFSLATDQVSIPQDSIDCSTQNDGADNGNLRESLLAIIPLCRQLKKIEICGLRDPPDTFETVISIDESFIGLQKKILELPLLNELSLPPYGNAFFSAVADLADKWPGKLAHNTEEIETMTNLDKIMESALRLWYLNEHGIAQMVNVFGERDLDYQIDTTYFHPIIWFPPRLSAPEQI